MILGAFHVYRLRGKIMPKNKNDRILVVDDNNVALNIVCKMLASLGYETIAAENGVEALRMMESVNGFKLVLTDINMPQMDGWNLASRIKLLKPDIPIIAITGEDPNSILPRLHGSGISHALFKPFKVDLLNDAMESILRTEKL
jgi:two-component system, NarL family, capsular synthesis sensor histidine kinase RcsC